MPDGTWDPLGLREKLCGQILHASEGITCAEKVPCKYHSKDKRCDYCIDGCNKECGCICHWRSGIPPNATHHGEGNSFSKQMENADSVAKLVNQKTPYDSVEPSNWEKKFELLLKDYFISKESGVNELKGFIRMNIQLESDKAYRRGERDMKEGIIDAIVNMNFTTLDRDEHSSQILQIIRNIK